MKAVREKVELQDQETEVGRTGLKLEKRTGR